MMKKNASIDTESTKSYLQSKLDKGAINLITPTLIGAAVRKMFGFTIIGWGLDILLRMMDVDFDGMVSDICGNVVSMATGNSKLAPSEIESAVSSGVDRAFSKAATSSHLPYLMVKSAGATSKALSSAIPTTSSFLKKSLLFTFNTALAVVGMELFSDFLKNQMGMKSDWVKLFGNLFSSKRESRQTKFPKNPLFQDAPEYQPFKVELNHSPPVTSDDVKSVLTEWTYQIYPSTDSSALSNSTDFHEMINKIYYANSRIAGLVNYFFIPSDFKGKKDVVDYFIDDVAAHSTVTAPTVAPVAPKQEKK